MANLNINYDIIFKNCTTLFNFSTFLESSEPHSVYESCPHIEYSTVPTIKERNSVRNLLLPFNSLYQHVDSPNCSRFTTSWEIIYFIAMTFMMINCKEKEKLDAHHSLHLRTPKQQQNAARVQNVQLYIFQN